MAGTLDANGRILHRAAGYDLLVWFVTHGRERAMRERLLDLAAVSVGESVVDIGCGTGTLAIAAKQRAGSTGEVYGIDASAAMIARAARKARRAAVDVRFQQALAEALPFSDASFDVVLSTVMLHHLGRKARQQCLGEIRRVLKPAGRLLLVDFAPLSLRGLLAHLRRHGHTKLEDIVALTAAAGLESAANGPVGLNDLVFVLAKRPAAPQPEQA